MPKVKEAPAAEVEASYRFHDEVASNPASRTRFAADPPVLDDCQSRIVEDLSAQGCAVSSVAELFSPADWDRLRLEASRFTARMELRYANGPPVKAPKPGRDAKPAKAKFAMARRHRKVPVEAGNPWLELAASARMLDTVNSYLGMWSKLTHVDQWYTPPVGSAAQRLGSTRWHRDYNDQHLVKVFVYLVDVDEGTGPLEYVPGSARGGPYAHVWPWSPAGETYPPPEEFEQHVPPGAARTFTAPAGTMILCNTSGFHRGGHATERARSVLVSHYVSPASLEALVDRNFDGAGMAEGRPDVVRYALT